ncbi:MAG: hypothetical protein CBD27_02425 [Rhodospirillaceae bacterium TMED167]|nr:hypothetical protein [Rhodospirillaceae bacterium]OUW29853.1 MAG: hypothetical protein CBD27_02425 [Rhodospirillaceae bacterium TMED167]
MGLHYPLVDIADLVAPDNGPDLRTAISGTEGSSTTAFFLTLDWNKKPVTHRHTRCDEITICLEGEGRTTIAGETSPLHSGHCVRVPAGVSHCFENTGTSPLKIVGFYIGAPDTNASGFELVTGTESKDPTDTVSADETLLHWDDVPPETMDKEEGWLINDFRLPFGAHNGSGTTLFRAQFFPGAVHKKHAHTNCEEIYYIISGHGLAGAGDDRVEVTAGQFHYIPAGVEHWLHNLSNTDPIHVIGVYIGSGSVAETGYVYRGDVTADDIAARTS